MEDTSTTVELQQLIDKLNENCTGNKGWTLEQFANITSHECHEPDMRLKVTCTNCYNGVCDYNIATFTRIKRDYLCGECSRCVMNFCHQFQLLTEENLHKLINYIQCHVCVRVYYNQEIDKLHSNIEKLNQEIEKLNQKIETLDLSTD